MSDFRLQVFVKVAKRLNLTQSAQELGISQPAVSKHIQELEIQYSTQLFDRSGNKISLTPAGKLFLIHAESILDQYGAMEAEMYRITGNYCGELRISADSPVIDDSLFTLFLMYCKRHPCIKITFTETLGLSIKDSLLQKKIDLAFTNGPVSEPGLKYTPYNEQKWAFIVYAKGVFANTDKVSLEEIVDYKLNINIFKSETPFDYNILLDHNKFMTQFSDLETIKYLMFKNDSISLLPLYSVEREIQDGVLKVIDLDGVTFLEEVGMLSREDESNHALQWFLDFAQEYNP